MPEFRPEDYAGFTEAIIRERALRDAAFLGLTETVCGFELQAMTLRHWLVLSLAGNPLLWGDEPSAGQVAQFLWVLSPGFSTKPRARKRFLKRCGNLFGDHFSFSRRSRDRRAASREKLIAACRGYMKDAVQDRIGAASQGFMASYYSSAAEICGVLGAKLGFTESEVIAMPLKRIFQYLRVINDLSDRPAPLGNPSDLIVSNELSRRN